MIFQWAVNGMDAAQLKQTWLMREYRGHISAKYLPKEACLLPKPAWITSFQSACLWVFRLFSLMPVCLFWIRISVRILQEFTNSFERVNHDFVILADAASNWGAILEQNGGKKWKKRNTCSSLALSWSTFSYLSFCPVYKVRFDKELQAISRSFGFVQLQLLGVCRGKIVCTFHTFVPKRLF